MRIALIASSLRLAGAEKQFVYVARTLFQAGIDARVFYLGGGDHYQTVLRESGIPLRQIFARNRPLMMLCRLLKEAYAFKPDMVLASQFGDLVFAAPAGRLCHALVLGGVRSDGFYEFRTSGRRRQILLRLSHGLIANSFRAKANLISLGVDARKVSVLPNVIDLADFDRKAAMPIANCVPPGRVAIAAVGSLHACKRFDRFLEALALAKLVEPSIFGVIAGKDLGEKTALEQKAKALGLLPRDLNFIGECDRIPALLKQVQLLVVSSDYEGFPNVILEAMAARLPVLTTPAGDASLIVQDRTTGYVLKAGDNHGMVEAILSLVRNSRLSLQLGEAGRRRVEQNYSFASLAQQLFPVLRDFARLHNRSSVLKHLEDHPVVNQPFRGPSSVIPAPIPLV